ncbi:hypothetical protein BAY59_31180 [Prauserella coralliicola]|nr:hypothetical protein BAY59_31180 [Prauserella coralliicola]
MTHDEYDSVGRRVARARRLAGITQQQLADRAHVGLGTIRHVEQGRIPASPSFVASVARALRVKPAHLYDTREDQVMEEPSADSATISDLRSALDAYDDPRPEGAPLTLAAISRGLGTVARAIHQERYDEAAPKLPPLLHHLYPLAEQSGRKGEQARAALHDAYRMAATIGGQYRQFDLAALAHERHIHLAPSTGDPLRVVVSAYHRSTRHLQYADFRAGLRLLTRARDHLDASPEARAMAVQLDLRSAVLAARAGDGQEADEYIAEARAILDEFAPPERPYFNIDASALNTAVHWCALPVEQYDAAESLRRNDAVRVQDPTRPERVGHHHIDMARACVLHGDREKALVHLNEARRISPRRTRQHPQVRETVVTLAEQERRRDDTLAGFARWAGIQV